MLIRWLRERQSIDHLNDAQFAAKLGISRSYWTMFKRGARQRPTYFLLQSAIRAYPNDRDALMSFLDHGVTLGTLGSTSGTRAIA